jgi:hypothetical protein
MYRTGETPEDIARDGAPAGWQWAGPGASPEAEAAAGLPPGFLERMRPTGGYILETGPEYVCPLGHVHKRDAPTPIGLQCWYGGERYGSKAMLRAGAVRKGYVLDEGYVPEGYRPEAGYVPVPRPYRPAFTTCPRCGSIWCKPGA